MKHGTMAKDGTWVDLRSIYLDEGVLVDPKSNDHAVEQESVRSIPRYLARLFPYSGGHDMYFSGISSQLGNPTLVSQILSLLMDINMYIVAAHLAQRHDTSTQDLSRKLQPNRIISHAMRVRVFKNQIIKKKSTKLRCCPMQVEAVESSKREYNACQDTLMYI